MFWSIRTFLKFQIKLWFWIRHESKLVVPNKWDDSKLDLCILIGELVKPLHKISSFFKNSSLLPPLPLVEIMSIYFLGIIYKIYVIIDDFVYFDHFCYAN